MTRNSAAPPGLCILGPSPGSAASGRSRPHAALDIRLHDALRGELAVDLPLALELTEEIKRAIERVDLSPLARHCPALLTYNWAGYLHCSVARVVHALAALRRVGPAGGRVLDYGSYFGNFALALARAGYQVDAIDSYGTYGKPFEPILQRMSASGVGVLWFEDCGFELRKIPDSTYDVVLCMSVIEHVPHTPRYVLDALDRVLKPGGRLVLETPNLAYIYNRQRLARGESVMAPLESQYYTDRCYEGHHREYTLDELVWLVRQISHQLLFIETFNYSYYGTRTLTGRDVENFVAMLADPSLREILLSVSRKRNGVADPSSADPSAAVPSWKDVLVETETQSLAASFRAALAELPGGG